MSGPDIRPLNSLSVGSFHQTAKHKRPVQSPQQKLPMSAQDQQRAREVPAPAIMAPSREDVLSNLAFFFGDPVVPEKLRDYSEHHAM